MNNQTIGIAGVFALTFFLLLLRHCLLSLGRANRNRYVNRMTSRETSELNTKAVEDDSWLLWSPEAEAGSRNRVDDAPRATPEPQDKRKGLTAIDHGSLS